MGSQTGTVNVSAWAFAPGTSTTDALANAPTVNTVNGTANTNNTSTSPTQPIGLANYQISVLQQSDGPTQFVGTVLDHTGKALTGVRLSISRTTLVATTNVNGHFEFADQVPPGKLDLFVDGRAVTRTAPLPPGSTQTSTPTQYPALHFEVLAIRGRETSCRIRSTCHRFS